LGKIIHLGGKMVDLLEVERLAITPLARDAAVTVSGIE